MEDQPVGPLSNLYLDRYAYPKSYLDAAPADELELIITIPCFNEQSLVPCFESLRACRLPEGIVIEVIAIVNEPENAAEDISNRNQQCYQEALAYAEKYNSDRLVFHLIYEKLTKKHAGVGLARKIIMDEAVRRFEEIEKPEGVIVCYDADCACDLNYFKAIYEFFQSNPKSPGAAIYFEHPLTGDEWPEAVYRGIVGYELYLRYYTNALRYAGYPYAFQTIGSSMAVRSYAYQKQGGMNRRKAGEDFYFLHKIMPMGHFGEINNTRVIPSPRPSDRVPFGTGRAINNWLYKGRYPAYDFQIFKILRQFLQDVPSFYQDTLDGGGYPDVLRAFLLGQEADQQIESIRSKSGNQEIFKRHFFHWFDGLMVLKYVHFARDHYYPEAHLSEEVKKLGKAYFNKNWEGDDLKLLLLKLRERDRQGAG